VDDSQWEKLAVGIGSTAGVLGDFTSPQLVYGDSTGMQIKVAADRYALVRGHAWWSGSSIFTKSIASNSSGSTRIDLVVLRLSRTTWDVTVTIIQGTPGAGAPAPTQSLSTTGNFDLVLATVTVANGAATITAANVTYVATHLSQLSKDIRVPSVAALAYVPLLTAGITATVSDATNSIYIYDGTSWQLKAFLSNLGQRQVFTPTLTAATTNPTMGSGAIRVGWYVYLPGLSILYNFFIGFGTSGAAPGSGSYAVSLPVAQGNPNAGAGIPAVGVCQMADASSGFFKTTSCFSLSNANTLGMVGDSPVNQGYPWTWANGDYIAGQIIYAG
jgi:hypothetical protein